MIVSSFSDPIALVCPPMVRESAVAEQLFEAFRHSGYQRHAEQAACLKTTLLTVVVLCVWQEHPYIFTRPLSARSAQPRLQPGAPWRAAVASTLSLLLVSAGLGPA